MEAHKILPSKIPIIKKYTIIIDIIILIIDIIIVIGIL